MNTNLTVLILAMVWHLERHRSSATALSVAELLLIRCAGDRVRAS